MYYINLSKLIFGLFCIFLSGAAISQDKDTSFSYNISSSVKTSAGVYKSDGTLVRTLWSGVTKAAGTYKASWDGKLDDLITRAPQDNYTVKIISNNIVGKWEGVIGNTSDALTGASVHRTFVPFQDMCVVDSIAFVCADFAERSSSVYKINLKDPQKKIDIFPEQTVQQTTNRVCSDGKRLYMGGIETQNGTVSYVAAVNIGDYNNYIKFQGGSVKTFNSTFAGCNIIDNVGRISGMAVQKSGNYLFVSRKGNNTVHVINKLTGVVVQTFATVMPTLLAVDGADNLWVAYQNGNLIKFMVDPNTGTLTNAGVTVSGLTNIQGLTIYGSTIAVSDAGAYHLVKGFSSTTGALIWTLGQNASYSTDANILDNKFCFIDARTPEDIFGFVAFQSDGSIWVNDKGNYRIQHFNSSRTYVNQIAFLPHNWSSFVDPNNPTRLFADYLEYSVDYSKPLQAGNSNNAWKLVKNWGFNVTTLQDGDHDRLKYATTLSNGRTYAFSHKSPYKSWEIVELVSGGTLRFTGVELPRYQGYQLRPDGSVIGFDYPGNVVWIKADLQGFDGSNNPQWSSFNEIVSVPQVSGDPLPGGETNRAGEITGTGVITSFTGGMGGGYHLGGIVPGAKDFKWKTAKTVKTEYFEPFPADGQYDIGQGSQYAGSTSLAIDNIIIWGHRGEGYAANQTNIWNIVYDNGLFLNQFGVVPDHKVYPPPQAQAGMAGNAFSPSLVKANGEIYLYHNDESYHGGIHRWKITGLNTILEQTINLTAATPSTSTPNNYYQSKGSGNWNDINTWQSSADSISWSSSTSIPSSAVNSITILNGHTVSVTDTATVDQLFINDGGVLIITTAATLTVNDDIGDDITVAPSGTLIVQSNATSTGRIGNSSGTIAGNVTIERFISASANKTYRMLSPSVNTGPGRKPFVRDNWQEGQNNTSLTSNSNLVPNYGTQITGAKSNSANGFDVTTSGAASLFSYNPMSDSNWTVITNTNATTLEAKKGYLILIRGDRNTNLRVNKAPSSTTLRATGTILSGTQLFTKPNGNRRTMLIGNPYPSPINWNTIYNDASTSNSKNFENYFTYWDPRVGVSGGYVTVNSNGIKSAATNATVELQSGEGFLITAKAGVASPTLTVKESHKSSTNNLNIFRTIPRKQFLTSLYYSSSNGTRIMADAVNTVFDNEFSLEVNGEDAKDMANPNENISIVRAGYNLSIEGRPLITGRDTIPLDIQRVQKQNYEWQFDPSNFSDTTVHAWLYDRFLKISTAINMYDVTVIPFSVNNDRASSEKNRFKIIFGSFQPPAPRTSSIKAYKKLAGIQVDWVTRNELNGNSYEIQKSSNSKQFTNVTAASNKSGGTADSSFGWFDANPEIGDNYYRIKTMTQTGDVKYSEAVVVEVDVKASFDVYPNPINGNYVVTYFKNLPAGTYIMKLIGNSGQTIYTKTISHPGGSVSHTLPLRTNLAPGIYMLQVTGNGILFSKHLVK